MTRGSTGDDVTLVFPIDSRGADFVIEAGIRDAQCDPEIDPAIRIVISSQGSFHPLVGSKIWGLRRLDECTLLVFSGRDIRHRERAGANFSCIYIPFTLG